jgi:hypothetical protein
VRGPLAREQLLLALERQRITEDQVKYAVVTDDAKLMDVVGL